MAELSNAQIINEVLSHGFDGCEVYRLESKNTNISVCHQTLELLDRQTEKGVGIRFFKGKRVGFGHLDNFEQTNVLNVIKTIYAVIDNLPEQEDTILAGKQVSDAKYHAKSPDNPFYDPEIESIPLSAKIDKVKAVENAAFAYSDMVRVSRVASYEEAIRSVHIANSNGLDVRYLQSKWRAMYIVIGGTETQRQMKTAELGGIFFRDFTAQELGREAAKKAIISAGGQAIPSGEMTVLLHSKAANQIFSRISNGFVGDTVDRNMSIFKDKLGRQIAVPQLTIVDDPLMPGGYKSSAYDDEGIPCQKVVLVDKGVLQSYLYSLTSAKKNNTQPTGSSRRSSYRAQPTASLSNLYVEKGDMSPEDMIRQIDYGLYFYNALDVRATNLVSGDFSINGDGVLIEKGKLTKPVTTVSIAGTIPEFLNRITCIGNDMTFEPIHPFFGGGNVASPTIMVTPLVVGSS